MEMVFKKAKGRKAELIFAEMRGTLIIKDCNLEEAEPHDDFIDSVLGTVDVKSASPSEYRSYKRQDYSTYFKFSTDGFTSNYAVFMAMDKTYERCLYYLYIPGYLVKGKSSITINKLVFDYAKGNSCDFPTLTEREWQKYIINQDYFDLLPKTLKRPIRSRRKVK